MSISINWGSGGNSGNATSTTMTVTLGTGSGSPFAAGDIIVVATADDGGSGVTTPTGFTKVVSGNFSYFYRVCTGTGDPSSTSLSMSGFSSGYLTSIAFTVTGATGIDPGWTSWTTGSGTSLAVGSISPTGSSDLLVIICADYLASSGPNGSITLPAGFTDSGNGTILSQHTGGTSSGRRGSGVAGGYQTLSSSGATGSQTFTNSHSDNEGGVLLAFSAPAIFSKSDNDSGSGSGDQQVTASVAVADSGTGTESESVFAIQPVSDSDSATGHEYVWWGGEVAHGTESQSVSTGPAVIVSSDLGTGADSSGQVSASLAGTDAGSGGDSGQARVSTGSSDAGSGIGLSGGILIRVSDADGAVLETGHILGLIGAPDGGSGSGGSITGVLSADAGSGTGSEFVTETVPVSGSDAGTGSEVQLVAVAGADAGTGSGSGTLAAEAAAGDAGTGSGGAAYVALGSADAGSGAGSGQLSASVADGDAGTGSSAETVPGQTSNRSDTDSGSGAGTGLITALVADGDTGSGASGAGELLAAADTGSGAEAQSVRAAAAGADAGTGTGTSGMELLAADTGLGAEAEAVAAAVRGGDSASGTGSLTLGEITLIDPPDTATGADSGLVLYTPAVADTGTGAGTEQLAASAYQADSGSGSGAGSADASVQDGDTGTGSSFESAHLTGTFYISDSDSAHIQEGDIEPAVDADTATGSEAQDRYATLTVADAGTGADTESLFVAYSEPNSSDSGTGSEGWQVAGIGTVVRLGTDSGTGSESYLSTYLPSDEEIAGGTETFSYEVGVFPFPPPWLFKPAGGVDRYRLVFRPGTPREQVVREYTGELRFHLAEMRELYEKIRYSDTLLSVGSSDGGSAAESSGPTATVTQYATQTRVYCEAG